MRRVIWLDCHSISARRRKYLSHLFNVYGGNDVRQTEVRTVEPLLPERSAFEDEIAIKKLKRHKSRGIVQILAELIKAGGRKVCSEIHNFLILFGKKYCLRSGRSRSLYLSIRRVIKQTAVITEAYQFCQLYTKCYPTSCYQS
jgi:hypothetical protein